MNMKKEIGSDFCYISCSEEKNNLFNDSIWFISGRVAFRAILQDIKEKFNDNYLKIGIPSYLCESIIEPIKMEKIDYKFYPVELANDELYIDYSFCNDCNIVLLLDYFGFENTRSDFKKNINDNTIIIRDLTHSMFVKKYEDADYYFCSIRKWAGFINGGFSIGINKKYNLHNYTLFEKIREKAITEKARYIENEISNKEYLKLFHDSEILLDNCDFYSVSDRVFNEIKYFDVENVKRTRRNNAKLIISELNKYCLYKNIDENDCPLCVPIIVKNRDELRTFLISKNIYLPIHWPKPIEVNCDYSNELYENELSLVCDQRYSTEEIQIMIDYIKDFMENKLC